MDVGRAASGSAGAEAGSDCRGERRSAAGGYDLAQGELSKHFADKSSISSIVIVVERRDGTLGAQDLAEIEKTATALTTADPGGDCQAELTNVTMRSPAMFALAGTANPLLSHDERAALIWLSLPYNYITKPAARLVKHAQEIVASRQLPTGLSAVVTGSAGFGYDYAIATQRSHDKTSRVTVASVLVILLLVYRAPVAAVVPLLAISLGALVVFKLLAIAGRFGFHNGMAEQIFTFVLLYGAGVDYSLLFMSRYREFLDQGHVRRDAITAALDASVATIFSSAVMTIAGVGMLCFARFSVFHNAGPAVMLAVAMAAIVASTLVPATLAIAGRSAFWPAKDDAPKVHSGNSRHSPWPRIARLVVARPGWVMAITCLALIPPALSAFAIDWNYDAIYSLKAIYPARQGEAMVERHWPVGEITPITVLSVADSAQYTEAWRSVAAQLATDLRTVADVEDIRCLSEPLGQAATASENAALMLLGGGNVVSQYVSSDRMAMRMSVVLKVPPFSHSAMNDTVAITNAAQASLAKRHWHGRTYLTGATVEMVDIRAITRQDFSRVAALALVAILLVVAVVLRELSTALFILAATVLSYLATLGITSWVFHSLGSSGLEWKVQMLLFIVLVAVGQDYSIFFAMRLKQERRHLHLRAATERSLVFTGPVISSCGLIMAATLGSIMAADVQTLVQLGFAFAVGMLIDTFIVRPLLLPAFIVLCQHDRVEQKAGLTKRVTSTCP